MASGRRAAPTTRHRTQAARTPPTPIQHFPGGPGEIPGQPPTEQGIPSKDEPGPAPGEGHPAVTSHASTATQPDLKRTTTAGRPAQDRASCRHAQARGSASPTQPGEPAPSATRPAPPGIPARLDAEGHPAIPTPSTPCAATTATSPAPSRHDQHRRRQRGQPRPGRNDSHAPPPSQGQQADRPRQRQYSSKTIIAGSVNSINWVAELVLPQPDLLQHRQAPTTPPASSTTRASIPMTPTARTTAAYQGYLYRVNRMSVSDESLPPPLPTSPASAPPSSRPPTGYDLHAYLGLVEQHPGTQRLSVKTIRPFAEYQQPSNHRTPRTRSEVIGQITLAGWCWSTPTSRRGDPAWAMAGIMLRQIPAAMACTDRQQHQNNNLLVMETIHDRFQPYHHIQGHGGEDGFEPRASDFGVAGADGHIEPSSGYRPARAKIHGGGAWKTPTSSPPAPRNRIDPGTGLQQRVKLKPTSAN